MKCSEIIKEVFDSSVKGKLVRATNDLFTTRATIGDRDIVFNAVHNDTEEGKSIWEIEFTEKAAGSTTYGKSGSGNELQVFSFVIDSIKELVSRYYPDELTFSAHKEDGNRSRLYQVMIKKIKLPGYHPAPVEAGRYDDMFRIVKDAETK